MTLRLTKYRVHNDCLTACTLNMSTRRKSKAITSRAHALLLHRTSSDLLFSAILHNATWLIVFYKNGCLDSCWKTGGLSALRPASPKCDWTITPIASTVSCDREGSSRRRIPVWTVPSRHAVVTWPVGGMPEVQYGTVARTNHAKYDPGTTTPGGHQHVTEAVYDYQNCSNVMMCMDALRSYPNQGTV
jgi:hypothetical protein